MENIPMLHYNFMSHVCHVRRTIFSLKLLCIACTRAGLSRHGKPPYPCVACGQTPKRLAKKTESNNSADSKSPNLRVIQSLSSAPSRPETPDLLPPMLPLCLVRFAAFSPTGKGSFHSFLQVGQISLPPCARHIFPTQCECKRAGHLSVGSGHRWPCVIISLQAMHTLIFSCG